MRETNKFESKHWMANGAMDCSKRRRELSCTNRNIPAITSTDMLPATRGNVFRLQTAVDLQYDPICEGFTTIHYRDAVCDLCEKTVSLALTVPLVSMQAKSRCSAEIALARQIAMYLCHTTFSLLLTEVGLHFGRDRSTVAHACNLIEDKRDDLSFDVLICQLEALLCDARHAMSICVEHDTHDGVEAAGSRQDYSYHLPMKQLTSRGA